MQAFRGGKYERNRIRGTEQRSANFFADGKKIKRIRQSLRAGSLHFKRLA